MAMNVQDIQKIFKFKFKERDDDLTDQYNRIFMSRVMILVTLITGLQWYSDRINCILPSNLVGGHLTQYTSRACWINGFYIYDHLRHMKGCPGYFGIPMSLPHNGTKGNTTCDTCVSYGKHDKTCAPMKKVFYNQFQWFPFFICTLSLFFYFPYLLFLHINRDLKGLKKHMEAAEPDVLRIKRTYFAVADEKKKQKQSGRILLNIMVKCIYILSNLFVLLLCDATLNGDYLNFGLNWLKWLSTPNRNNYVDSIRLLNAGPMLIPSFGICEVLEEAMDIKHITVNEHKLLCEISQHVLYQYAMMLLWFLLMVGLVISVVGLLTLIVQYATWTSGMNNKEYVLNFVLKNISIRQGEYLFYIRKRNEVLYAKILNKLYEEFKGDKKSTGSSIESLSEVSQFEAPETSRC